MSLSHHREKNRMKRQQYKARGFCNAVLGINRDYHWLCTCRSSASPTGQAGASWLGALGEVFIQISIYVLSQETPSPHSSVVLSPTHARSLARTHTHTHTLSLFLFTDSHNDRRTDRGATAPPSGEKVRVSVRVFLCVRSHCLHVSQPVLKNSKRV